jgi:hypothetical protein
MLMKIYNKKDVINTIYIKKKRGGGGGGGHNTYGFDGALPKNFLSNSIFNGISIFHYDSSNGLG